MLIPIQKDDESISEMWADMRELKRERHQDWYDKNTKILEESKLKYTWANDTCILFREKNIKVDFYPHTGRWKYKNKMYRGGAKAFITWYKKLMED